MIRLFDWIYSLGDLPVSFLNKITEIVGRKIQFVGARNRGDIDSHPAMEQAYEMGKEV